MFNRTTESLPAVQTSTAVAIAAEPGSAIVTAGRVPKTVQRGVLDVMLAFPTHGRPDADTRIVRDLYLEAVHGYPRAVVEWTLKFLVFNNPRNTPTFSCPPTPQDVREACQLTQNCWENCIINYYFEGAWATASTYGLSKAVSDRYHAVRGSRKPGEPDCIISEDLQIEYLRGAIERQLPGVESETPNRDGVLPQLLMIEDSLLDRMPGAAFPDGALERIRRKRAARVEAAVKAAEHKAYLKSLPDEVLTMRSILIASMYWESEDELEIRAEVDRRLKAFHEAKREAENNGGQFLGMTFADGSELREHHIRRLTEPARGAL